MKKSTKTILSIATIIFLVAAIFVTASQLFERDTDDGTINQEQVFDFPFNETESSDTKPESNKDDNTTETTVSSTTTTQNTNTEQKDEKIYGVADVIKTHTVVENNGKTETSDETTSNYAEKEATTVTDAKTPPAPPKKETTKTPANDDVVKADTFIKENNISSEETIVENVDKVDEEEVSDELNDLFN